MASEKPVESVIHDLRELLPVSPKTPPSRADTMISALSVILVLLAMACAAGLIIAATDGKL